MQCASCKKVVTDPPVYRCYNEHIFCGRCYEISKAQPKALKCSSCSSVLTSRKSMIVERILSKLAKTKCMYGGCAFAMVDPERVKEHEATCVHRPVLCYTCFESVALPEMTSHIRENHRNCKTWQFDFDSTASLSCPMLHSAGTVYSDPIEIRDDESASPVITTFFFNRVVEEGRYLYWVTHTLTPSTANDRLYRYRVSVFNRDQEKDDEEGGGGGGGDGGMAAAAGGGFALAQYSGFCTSHDSHPYSMKKSMFCLVVPNDVIDQCVNERGKYRLDMTISKVCEISDWDSSPPPMKCAKKSDVIDITSA